MRTKKHTNKARRVRGCRETTVVKLSRMLFIVCLMLGFAALPAFAQTPAPTATPDPTASPSNADDTIDDSKKDDKAKKPKRGSLIIAPIPITSPTFGGGMILGVGYVFKLNTKDQTSPPSTVGVATAFTSSGSRALAFFGHFYFDENKYQATIGGGSGRARYDFYGIGRIPGREAVVTEMRQSGSVFFGEFMRNFGKKIFVGPRYQYRKLTATLGGQTTPGGFEIPTIDLLSTTAAIGVHVQRDLRDNSFYPRKGSLFDFKADFFAKAFGSNRNYQTYSIAYSGYHGIGEKQVVAYRGMACSVSDRAPFFDLCFFGSNSNLRGYTGGQFQDRRMFATQVEYRRELPYRLGIVGFAGIGGVAPQWDKFQFNKLLPAVGVGLRFKLEKTHHINYRVDLGFGRSGHTLSLSVTEAF